MDVAQRVEDYPFVAITLTVKTATKVVASLDDVLVGRVGLRRIGI